MIEAHPVVILAATAGAGKTTAVATALASASRPVAWLTLDRTDALPGRLLVYLEAALGRAAPQFDDIASRALAAGISHREAAGLLIQAVTGLNAILVLDELERLERSEAAWGAIEAVLRYAPPDLRIVLISRQDIPTDLCAIPINGVAWLREDDLSFTIEEARRALTAMGGESIDAAKAVEATGGWVTGVLFEAWRSDGHVDGAGGKVDPLHGYLAAHVLGMLAHEDQEFLVTTSLLDEVTATRAEALGQLDAVAHMSRLRAAHLPVTWEPGGRVMRCHSRFREYLLERLQRRGARETRELHLLHGRLLASEGHHEEATEEFLLAGDRVEALHSAQEVIEEIVDRLDIPVAERWLAALADVIPPASSPFTVAEIMLALAHEDYGRGVRIADDLAARAEREQLVRSSERAAAMIAWCYGGSARLDDYEAILQEAPHGPMIAAAQYVTNLSLATAGAPRPQPTGGPSDALLALGDFSLGRLSELTETSATKWDQALAGPWRIAALRASGQTRRALTMFQHACRTVTPSTVLKAVIGPEVLIDAGQYQEARRLLSATRADAQLSSQWVWLENCFAELRLVLRVDRDTAAAREIIRRVENVAYLIPFHGETLDTWRGLCLLLEGADEEAATALRLAVKGMLAGDRMLYLPTAAVYLAESEWRLGNESAADEAADEALRAARRQGSNHLLLQALCDFPVVASRRIDAEADSGSVWHTLGRSLARQGTDGHAALGSLLELREFSETVILVDGCEVRPAISKSFELLAFLATKSSGSAEREQLLDALFDGRTDDSARSYLRQAIRRLRQVLPGDDLLRVERGRVSLRSDLRVNSESEQLCAELAEMRGLRGEAKLNGLQAALSTFDRGEYLPGIRSQWAETRRQELSERAQDARLEAAELAFGVGRYHDARRLQAEVLDVDPYREAGWRLEMRIASALGDDDGVIRAYRNCAETLAGLGAAPTAATQALLQALRH